MYCPPLNEPFRSIELNQATKELVKQPPSRPNQTTGNSINKPTIKERTKKSNNQISQSIKQASNQSSKQASNRSISRSINQSINLYYPSEQTSKLVKQAGNTFTVPTTHTLMSPTPLRLFGERDPDWENVGMSTMQ